MPITLDPDATAVIQAFRDAGRPAYETLKPDEARQFYLAAREVTNPEPPPIASVEATVVPGPGGPIPARLYRPLTLRQSDGLAPCLIFFHGGGWVIGNLETHDVVCRTLAAWGEMIVIAIDYRLAPEHKFPAAVDDAVAATQWIANNALSLGVDVNHLVVGGDSAGGNLAAVVALHARDAGPSIAGQLLIYPVTDLAMTHPSHSEPETDVLLTHAVMRWFRDHYLNGPSDIDNWKASPARENNLRMLPPAFVLTAGADPLRDEGNEFANRLAKAGVAVTHQTYPGQFHGFITMGKLLPKSHEALHHMAIWLKAL